MSLLRTRSPRRGGFSLIEITLALGVAGVALVSIVGLLGVAANSNRTAGRDTTMVSMTHQVLADLRAANFDDLWDAVPWNENGTPKLNKPATGSAALAPASSVYFFTADGTPVPAAKAKSNPETAYECTVRKVPDPVTRTANSGAFNLLRLELLFVSPPGASSANAVNRQTVHASLARY